MWRHLWAKQGSVKHGWDGMTFPKHKDSIQQKTSIILSHVHTTRKIACVARDRCARCGVLFTGEAWSQPGVCSGSVSTPMMVDRHPRARGLEPVQSDGAMFINTYAGRHQVRWLGCIRTRGAEL